MYEVREKILIKQMEYLVLRYLIIWYPILISIGRFIPIIGTLLTLTLLCILVIENIYTKKFWVKYSVITILFIISFTMYPENVDHIAHIKVLLIFFLSMDCFYRNFYDRYSVILKKYSWVLQVQITMILLVNIGFFFSELGYSQAYTQDWGFKAFQGIYLDPHQAAYHLCALLVFVLWISRYRYRYFQWILVIGLEYCILMTGARVPTVMGIALGGLFCLDHKIEFKSNSKILKKFLDIYH